MSAGGNAALTLTRPVAGDVPELAAMGRAWFTASFGHLYAAPDLAAFLAATHDEGVIAQRVADPARAYCLARSDDRLVGYVQLLLADGFDHPTSAERPVTLSQLYCAPGETGRGIGGALMAWTLAAARRHGADEMRLSVWSQNHGAQRFYARHGFVYVADIDFWVGAHRDEEFLYALKL